MTYTVTVYNNEPGYAWQVADETGLVIDQGTEVQWTEALSQAALVMAVNLGNHYGAPEHEWPGVDGQ